MLGPLEVRSDGRSISIGRGKQRSLLAVLALDAGRVVPVERLIDELWGDAPPPTATTALQVYVSKLRKALGEGAIETRAPGYVLRCGPDELDLRRFEQLTSEAQAPSPSARPRSCARRSSSGAARRSPTSTSRSRPPGSQELRLAAVERRIDADLARGAAAEVAGELEALVAAHPLRESFRAQLMLALYRAGRQAEALETYRDGRRLLSEDLGIEPGARLQQLEQSILRQDVSLAEAGEQTISASAVFVDLGVTGEVDVVAERALTVASEELGKTAARVERGLADALLAVFSDADDAIAAATAVVARLTSEFGDAVAPRAGIATADVTLAVRAKGPAPVLAARRVRLAKPGEVVVGARTAAAAPGHAYKRRRDCYVVG